MSNEQDPQHYSETQDGSGSKTGKIHIRDYYRSGFVPIGLRMAIFFQGVEAILGTVFFLVGMLFVLIFFPTREIEGWVMLSNQAPKAQGTVTELIETSSSENDATIFRILYRFETPSGETVEGKAYSTFPPFKVGDEIEVIYSESHPDINKIKGMRRSAFPVWIMFVSIFALVGFFFLVRRFRAAKKAVYLLEIGQVTTGVYEGMTTTGASINDVPVMRLAYNFNDYKGSKHTAFAETHRPELLNDGEPKKVLFDPNEPDNALVVENLPKSVRKYFGDFPMEF